MGTRADLTWWGPGLVAFQTGHWWWPRSPVNQGSVLLAMGTKPRMVALPHHHCHCLLCLHLVCKASSATTVAWTATGMGETLLVRPPDTPGHRKCRSCLTYCDKKSFDMEIVTYFQNARPWLSKNCSEYKNNIKQNFKTDAQPCIVCFVFWFGFIGLGSKLYILIN